MTDIYSSVAACDAVAKRVIRTAGQNKEVFTAAVRAIMRPIAEDLLRKGKLRREDLPEHHRTMTKALTEAPNIVDLDVALIRSSPLSVNQTRTVRFIMVASELDDQWLHFFGCEMELSRHSLRLRINGTDFRVSSHLLSRYMQRERTDLAQFFEKVNETLRTAALLGPASGFADDVRTAVPFRGGLLLGDTMFVPADEVVRPYPVEVIYDAEGGRQVVGQPDLLIPGQIPLMCMATFIDADSLSPSKERLRDMIAQWHQAHYEGISTFSSALLFGKAPVKTRESQAAIRKGATEAFYAALELVQSDAWRRFSTRDGG